VKEFLVEKGYDPLYGARPLRRTIQSYIEDPFAELLLEGRFVEGDIVRVDLDKNNNIEFKKVSLVANR
jgi:ATP-dependent Clp protease ATP-binding subunit ClpA